MRHSPDGTVVEIDARTRTIPPALRRALHHRDRGCRFPGCGLQFTDGHHIRHWANGGPTTLSNLVLLCRRHHRAVHGQGFTLEREPGGELRFYRPEGRPLPDSPAAPHISGDVVEMLRTRHDADGACPHTRIASSGWSGERLDVGYAIDILHPLAIRPSPRAALAGEDWTEPAGHRDMRGRIHGHYPWGYCSRASGAAFRRSPARRGGRRVEQGTVKRRAPANAARRASYYSVVREDGEIDHAAEELLRTIESAAAPVIARLRGARRISRCGMRCEPP